MARRRAALIAAVVALGAALAVALLHHPRGREVPVRPTGSRPSSSATSPSARPTRVLPLDENLALLNPRTEAGAGSCASRGATRWTLRVGPFRTSATPAKLAKVGAGVVSAMDGGVLAALRAQDPDDDSERDAILLFVDPRGRLAWVRRAPGAYWFETAVGRRGILVGLGYKDQSRVQVVSLKAQGSLTWKTRFRAPFVELNDVVWAGDGACVALRYDGELQVNKQRLGAPALAQPADLIVCLDGKGKPHWYRAAPANALAYSAKLGLVASSGSIAGAGAVKRHDGGILTAVDESGSHALTGDPLARGAFTTGGGVIAPGSVYSVETFRPTRARHPGARPPGPPFVTGHVSVVEAASSGRIAWERIFDEPAPFVLPAVLDLGVTANDEVLVSASGKLKPLPGDKATCRASVPQAAVLRLLSRRGRVQWCQGLGLESSVSVGLDNLAAVLEWDPDDAVSIRAVCL